MLIVGTGPGVGKTFLANALGHIAVRRQHSAHTERADKLFKRLRGARLDGSYEDEMRKLHRVEYASKWGRRGVLIIDDLALGLEEIAQLGRTLWRRRDNILAFFDYHASKGPTEAINRRLEALRRNALGFRNLTHYRLALTAPQRRTPRTHQCTLNYEEPAKEPRPFDSADQVPESPKPQRRCWTG